MFKVIVFLLLFYYILKCNLLSFHYHSICVLHSKLQGLTAITKAVFDQSNISDYKCITIIFELPLTKAGCFDCGH